MTNNADGKTMDDALSRIFDARSRHGWSDRPVPEDMLRKLYDWVKFGPTSMNTSPARFHFLVSQASRTRLAAHMMDANKAKVLSAPCAVIIAQDNAFYDFMPKLFPMREGVREMFASKPAFAADTAFRNASLQGAYLIVAARLMGLDAGPMSGFDTEGVNREFFDDTSLAANFICTIGYANDEPFPRLPRLGFEEAAQIL